MLVAIGAAALTAALLITGVAQLVAVGVLGFSIAIGMVTWRVGDIHALPYMWGALGEQQTAAELAQLDHEWLSVHDVSRRRGNWDHICVGPAGVFAIESKVMSDSAVVRNDTLRCGRMSYRGGTFRRAAIELKDEIARHDLRPPYVHAVVVIWGDFAQRRCDEEHVAYIGGDELLAWLRDRPAELSQARLANLRRVVQVLADRRERASASEAVPAKAAV